MEVIAAALWPLVSDRFSVELSGRGSWCSDQKSLLNIAFQHRFGHSSISRTLELVAAHRAAPHCAAAYHLLVCCKTGGRAASSAEWCWSMLLLGLLHNRRALRGSSQDLLSSSLKNIEIFLPKYISPP